MNTVERTGIDAALGIDDVQDKLEYLIKGQRNPIDYFDLFRNSLLVQKHSHVWFRDKVVTMIDDHDQVRKGNNKARLVWAQENRESLALSYAPPAEAGTPYVKSLLPDLTGTASCGAK